MARDCGPHYDVIAPEALSSPFTRIHPPTFTLPTQPYLKMQFSMHACLYV